jgi:hypothetical protein
MEFIFIVILIAFIIVIVLLLRSKKNDSLNENVQYQVTGKIFIVKEEWQNNVSSDHTKHDWFILGQPETIFNEGSDDERLQKAKKHLKMRFRYIATRRCLSKELQQAKFTITLLSLEKLNDNFISETIMQVDDANYPIPDELKDGLYTVKK